MKVLSNSIILGTRRFCVNVSNWAEMSYDGSFFRYVIQIFSIWSSLEIFYHCAKDLMCKKTAQWTIKKIDWLKTFLLQKIKNIHHNFLVPKMIESAPKTFIHIQTRDLHRLGSLFAFLPEIWGQSLMRIEWVVVGGTGCSKVEIERPF